MAKRARNFFNSPAFHLTMSLVWIGLLIPSLLFWQNSVLWVIFLSLYANFVGHWSAYQAARAERSNGNASEE